MSISKIKEIKIREEDGSYSDPIPMGADAINIDTANGSNLETDLININNKFIEKDTQISNLENKDITLNSKIDDNINNLQNQINGLASGSPLVANSIEEMTDTTRVYVNITDGYWYYWSGSAWTKGDIYQATVLTDGSISLNHLDSNLQANEANINFQKNVNNAFSIWNKMIIPLMNYANRDNGKEGYRYSSYNKTTKTVSEAVYAGTKIVPPFPVHKGVTYYSAEGFWVDPWSYLVDPNGNYIGTITRSTSNFHYWTCPADGYIFPTFESVDDYSKLTVLVNDINNESEMRTHIGIDYGVPYDYWMLQDGRYTSVLSDIEDIKKQLENDDNSITITVGAEDRDYTTITAAVASITDSSKNKVYNIVIDDGTYEERDITLPDYVNIVGASGDYSKCIIKGYLPASTSPNLIAPSSTFNANKNHEFRNVTITCQNMRYPVHSESGGGFKNWSIIIDNCYIEHKGNQEAIDYQAKQENPQTVWSSYHAWGEGASSGAYLKATNSTFKSSQNAFYTHAAPSMSKPYVHILENCHLLGNVSIDDTTSPINGDTLLINNCDIQGRIYIIGTHKYNMIISGSGIHPIYQKPERVLSDIDFPVFTDYLKRITCTEAVSRGQFVYSDDGMKTVKKATSSTPKQLIVGYVVGNWSANSIVPIMTAGSLQPITQTWPESDTLTPGKYYRVGDNSILVETENINEAIAISSTRWYWLIK